ncbi:MULTISPECIES: hypothetical protein [unclassified Wolbachia]|uniref:hypothetical protein n=1 Tax=unclassified Wolbachia TaxID=2640676 RepID=UPI0021F87F43|nr:MULTISPECIES: hypothetical protein [unclassified Wolbachia]
MLGTTQETQNELGKFNSEQWDKFVKDSIEKKNEDLEAVKEQSKKNKEENAEVLEKHFHDRTLQPISEFKKVGEKEAGCSSGFQAEHEYSDNEGDKAAFMVKSVLNHTLTKEEKQSKLAQFKESFYKGSRKATKLQNPYLPNFVINNNLDLLWQQVESDICYDDLNIADFIREYVAGDLYKLFLYDRAPIVELVTNNDLPRERFIKSDTQKGKGYKPGKYDLERDGKEREGYVKGKHIFKDQFKERIEQEKNQDKLHLRSKFLDKFTTLMDLQEKRKNYQDAEGFEKILAAQILLGEADIVTPENFGVIEKEYENANGEKVKEKLWAKIDHGRSLYSCVNNWSQIFLYDFKTLYGIEVDYERLALELSAYVRTISENEQLIEGLIDKKVSSLNQLLNPEMKFTLRYVSRNMPAVFCKEVFSYSAESKGFVSDKGNSLGSYFKQRLKSQIQTMREYSEVLHVTSAIENNFQSLTVNLPAFFNSQIKDPLIWAVETGKKLDGKDPIIWAIDNGKNIEGKKPGKCAAEHNLLINGKNPETFANKVQLAKFVNKASLPIAGLAIVACTGFIIANLSMALIISAAVVAVVAALIVKPIASYVQRDLLQNSIVSRSLNNPKVEEFQREPQLA